MKQVFAIRTVLSIALFLPAPSTSWAADAEMLSWKELPSLPGELGVAGPFAGAHNDALIVAGGANFARPVWKHEKAFLAPGRTASW